MDKNDGIIQEGDIFEGNGFRYIVLYKNKMGNFEVAKFTKHSTDQLILSPNDLYNKKFIKNIMEL